MESTKDLVSVKIPTYNCTHLIKCSAVNFLINLLMVRKKHENKDCLCSR